MMPRTGFYVESNRMRINVRSVRRLPCVEDTQREGGLSRKGSTNSLQKQAASVLPIRTLLGI